MNGSLDALRYYLRQWARWVRAWSPNLGYPKAVPYIDGRLPLVPPGYADEGDCATETEERIEIFIMRLIDTGVQNLPTDQCHAIRLRYLNEGASVWRSGRLVAAEAQRLAEDGERQLMQFVTARGLQL